MIYSKECFFKDLKLGKKESKCIALKNEVLHTGFIILDLVEKELDFI